MTDKNLIDNPVVTAAQRIITDDTKSSHEVLAILEEAGDFIQAHIEALEEELGE